MTAAGPPAHTVVVADAEHESRPEIPNTVGWPGTTAELEQVQQDLAERAFRTELWRPPASPYVCAGVFVAFSTGALAAVRDERAWAASVSVESGRHLSSAVLRGSVEIAYMPGYLALREGPLLERVVRSLDVKPDVLIVNASGRDHPRRAGLALHLGAVLGVPTVGVTDRPLVATGTEPDVERGASEPLVLEGEIVGHRLRSRRGARSVCAHAAWRTDPAIACEVIMAAVERARTPEPLRVARFLARSNRARDEGRAPSGWTQGTGPSSLPLGRGRRTSRSYWDEGP
jgi:deoxyribonuclease V